MEEKHYVVIIANLIFIGILVFRVKASLGWFGGLETLFKLSKIFILYLIFWIVWLIIY
jgi:hypothetical protein